MLLHCDLPLSGFLLFKVKEIIYDQVFVLFVFIVFFLFVFVVFFVVVFVVCLNHRKWSQSRSKWRPSALGSSARSTPCTRSRSTRRARTRSALRVCHRHSFISAQPSGSLFVPCAVCTETQLHRVWRVHGSSCIWGRTCWVEFLKVLFVSHAFLTQHR